MGSNSRADGRSQMGQASLMNDLMHQRALTHLICRTTTDCPGSGKDCCSEACGDDLSTENFKIVPGRDCYDEAKEDFDHEVFVIIITCVPIPYIGPGGRVGGKVIKRCWPVVKRKLKDIDESLKENARNSNNPRDRTGRDSLQKGKDIWDDINRKGGG